MYIRNIRNIPDITCQEWMYLVQISVNSCHPLKSSSRPSGILPNVDMSINSDVVMAFLLTY